jgi:hypothetical protein
MNADIQQALNQNPYDDQSQQGTARSSDYYLHITLI